jgi:hypothetical protein
MADAGSARHPVKGENRGVHFGVLVYVRHTLTTQVLREDYTSTPLRTDRSADHVQRCSTLGRRFLRGP